MKEILDLEFLRTGFVCQLCHETLMKSLTPSCSVSSSVKRGLFYLITEHVQSLCQELRPNKTRLWKQNALSCRCHDKSESTLHNLKKKERLANSKRQDSSIIILKGEKLSAKLPSLGYKGRRNGMCKGKETKINRIYLFVKCKQFAGSQMRKGGKDEWQ